MGALQSLAVLLRGFQLHQRPEQLLTPGAKQLGGGASRRWVSSSAPRAGLRHTAVAQSAAGCDGRLLQGDNLLECREPGGLEGELAFETFPLLGGILSRRPGRHRVRAGAAWVQNIWSCARCTEGGTRKDSGPHLFAASRCASLHRAADVRLQLGEVRLRCFGATPPRARFVLMRDTFIAPTL